jgi:RNA polymerase sigma-70 factor (ECF subfamily)
MDYLNRENEVAPASGPDLVPHLFRSEYSKVVAVLVRHFGLEKIEVAEDLASETFLAAVQSWSFDGVPKNPRAWIYAVAKNKARNYTVRASKVREVGSDGLESVAGHDLPVDLSDANISDSQLRMIFTVCHPAISTESQVGLALRILCGFSIEEIADAFLSSKETIYKRLQRAKETLRREASSLEVPGESEMEERLGAVLTTLYLLFSEGYYSESHPEVLRQDLAWEAMRLGELLLDHSATNRPVTRALLALMCFQSSRFPARRGEDGEPVLYAEQDESKWDQTLIARGAELLRRASGGESVSPYHLEASIAYWHTVKEDTPEKWESILMLYNQLLQIKYSPIAALNRTFALAKVKGKAAAIKEAEKLRLTNNHFYFVLLGELYREVDPEEARRYLDQAFGLARTSTDRQTIRRKLDMLAHSGSQVIDLASDPLDSRGSSAILQR